MSDAGLEQLRARLTELDDAPVGAHPDVLDEVHRAIVGELGDLSESRANRTPAGHRS